MFETMKTLTILLSTLAAAGYCLSPDLYFGTVDTRQYRDSVAKLNSFIACMLKISPCRGLDANIQARATETIASSCGLCDNAEKAVIHDLTFLIAQKNPKILKAIIRRYDLDSKYSKPFLRAIYTFPTKAFVTNIPNFHNN